jgi:hypothetical protein
MPPVGDETDDRWVMETDDGCEITESNFPNADLVCPDCGRTWGDDDCEHESVTIDELLEHPDNTDSAWALGTCMDCDEPLHVLLEVGDVREVESGRRASSASRDSKNRDEVDE